MVFGERVIFVGLQGSYARGEASDNSDIDAVVVLDTLRPNDLRLYDALLEEMPHRELACGFLSGKKELERWVPADLFQFYHDTTPILGNLDFLRASLGTDTAQQSVLAGACAIYHACVHNLLHEKDPAILRGLYKSAVFVIQAVHYSQTGQYVKTRPELLAAVTGPERGILQSAMELTSGRSVDTDDLISLSEALIFWTQDLIAHGGQYG